MNVLLIEPFFSGSHQSWAESYQKFSKNQVNILSLPGKHWKWRMEGAAITLAQEFKTNNLQPDVILTTDMLNLPLFQSLAQTKTIPTVLYMHENQLTYPWSENDREKSRNRDFHYAFLNYTSALVSDLVLFNSNYHLKAFIEELPEFLKMFPDHRGMENIQLIEEKSHVNPIGINFEELDSLWKEKENDIPTILWNHRWEYDKNPELFFKTLLELKQENIPFKLVVLGEHTQTYPAIFDEIKHSLADELIHWGYCESRKEYIQWLWKSDVLPVTSRQDFFGISAVEAMYCNTYPILPHRLAFPEHLPNSLASSHLYISDNDFKSMLKRVLMESKKPRKALRLNLRKYDQKKVYAELDKHLERLCD